MRKVMHAELAWSLHNLIRPDTNGKLRIFNPQTSPKYQQLSTAVRGSGGVLCGHCPDGWSRDKYPDFCEICPEDPSGDLAATILATACYSKFHSLQIETDCESERDCNQLADEATHQ